MTEPGRLYGVGVGPGDPDLMTMKAVKVLQHARVVAYFAKAGRCGTARTIVEGRLAPGCEELPLHYPMTTEVHFKDPAYNAALRAFYEHATAVLSQRLAEGRDVALLCEGDPFFYGSFMHLYVRLRERFEVTIIPGVTGMSGCWTAAGEPITWGDDVLTVLPATLPYVDLAKRLAATDACVVMKIGRHIGKVREAIEAAGLTERALYVERGTMANERVMPLSVFDASEAPYFSIVVVPGRGRRP